MTDDELYTIVQVLESAILKMCERTYDIESKKHEILLKRVEKIEQDVQVLKKFKHRAENKGYGA